MGGTTGLDCPQSARDWIEITEDGIDSVVYQELSALSHCADSNFLARNLEKGIGESIKISHDAGETNADQRTGVQLGPRKPVQWSR